MDVNLLSDETIEVQLEQEEQLLVEIEDINYIPDYSVAEIQRQKNEALRIANENIRMANENERIEFVKDLEQKVENGYFNGEKGEKGDKGDQGEKGQDGTMSFEELTEEQKASLKGDQGEKGEQGENGVGVPTGGTSGQILAKKSDTDFDTEWVDNTGGDIVVPTKISELENDSDFLQKNANYNLISGRAHFYNAHESGNGKTRIDIAVENIQGASSGGSASELYLNKNSDKDVRILENGTGTLYYKGNEVADRYYVDEQIANIDISNEDIDLTDYATKDYVNEQISNIEVSGGSGEGNTYIDSLPIGSVIAFDGDVIPEGFEEVEEYQPVYSLNETRIGTWYNGKPIYRKVYIATKTTSSQLHINLGDTTDIEDFWINNGISHLKPNLGVRYKPLNTYESADYYIRAEASLNSGTGDIYIAGSPSDFYAGIVRVVFEYTKISDKGVEASETN